MALMPPKRFPRKLPPWWQTNRDFLGNKHSSPFACLKKMIGYVFHLRHFSFESFFLLSFFRVSFLF